MIRALNGALNAVLADEEPLRARLLGADNELLGGSAADFGRRIEAMREGLRAEVDANRRQRRRAAECAAMHVLQTSRLELRSFDADRGAAALLALVNDPVWIRHIGARDVRDLDEARRYIDERLRAPCERQGFGLWAMQRRDDGAVAGMCGLVRREGLPAIDLGYALLPAHRGLGLVHEAAQATLCHARDVLGERRVPAITAVDNERSVRVLGRLGPRCVERRRLPGHAADSLVFEWIARAAREGAAGAGPTLQHNPPTRIAP